MIIESIEVIPMTKESKWEDAPRLFEVSMITTDYVKWFAKACEDMLPHQDRIKINIDGHCIEFAKRQKVFMLAPTAIFGTIMYAAKSKIVDTLDGIFIDGPLYRVEYVVKDDISAEKTVERTYVDPTTSLPMHGLWYPQKKMYNVRYGHEFNV
jgi:hypothetical protein